MTRKKEEHSLPLKCAEAYKLKYEGQNRPVGLGEEVLNGPGSFGIVWLLRPLKLEEREEKGGC